MSAGSPIRHRPGRQPHAWPFAVILTAVMAVTTPACAQTLRETLAAAYLANPDLAVGRARLDVVARVAARAVPLATAAPARDHRARPVDGRARVTAVRIVR